MFDEFDGRNSLFAAFSFFAALVPTSVLISNPWVDDYFVDGIRSTVAVACGIVIGSLPCFSICTSTTVLYALLKLNCLPVPR